MYLQIEFLVCKTKFNVYLVRETRPKNKNTYKRESRDLLYHAACYLSLILSRSSSMSTVTTKPVVSCRAQSSRQQREKAGGERREMSQHWVSLNELSYPYCTQKKNKKPTTKCFITERLILKTKPWELLRYFSKSRTDPWKVTKIFTLFNFYGGKTDIITLSARQF